jgi:uncharacterized protein (TIGR02145 family)
LVFGAFFIVLPGCNKDKDDVELTVIDIDGNEYKTVQIGSQVWMAENLRVTKFNDGMRIPLVASPTSWRNLVSPGYCWQDNDEVGYKDFGALYNWYVVQSDKVCPDGWHVPDEADWAELETTLGGYQVAGGKLKEVGTEHWNDPNTGATDEYGFRALPTGYRGGYDGLYGGFGNSTGWWSRDIKETGQAWVRYVFHNSDTLYSGGIYFDAGGCIRCLQD